MRQKIIRGENLFWKFVYVVSHSKRDWATWLTVKGTFKDKKRELDYSEIVITNDALKPLIAALQAALKEAEGKA